MEPTECQFVSLKSIAEGNDRTPPKSLRRHLLLFVRRHMSPSQERAFFRKADHVIALSLRLRGRKSDPVKTLTAVQPASLKAGDRVRVRSKEEIESTLNHVRQTKGCAFIDDVMLPYCGTVQRVLKPMERFVDERELRVKKCRGLILLEGVMCQGNTAYGRCDRSCYVFWREEWLEKLE